MELLAISKDGNGCRYLKWWRDWRLYKQGRVFDFQKRTAFDREA